MKTDPKRPIFEIQDSEINVIEIMEEIESRIKLKKIDLEELERISRLNTGSNSPAAGKMFDPAYTANLFQKGVSPPGFSNPSYWFIKGPLKWFLIKFVQLYSLFDKKISDNRIKAFYNVVHELIELRAKYSKLEKKLEEITGDYLDLKSMLGKEKYDLYNPEHDKLFLDYISKSNNRILNLLKQDDKVLILFPEGNQFIHLLEQRNIQFKLISDDKSLYEFIKKNFSSRVELIDSYSDFMNFQEYNEIIFYGNACKLPGWLLQRLIHNIWKSSSSGAKIIFRFSNSAITFHSPFQELYLTRISPELMIHFLKDFGFKNIVHHVVDEDEFELFTFMKP